MSRTAAPTATAPPVSLDEAISLAGSKANATEGISLTVFLASFSVAAVVFGVQFLIFVLLRGRLIRIYSPRSYLVPESERVDPPPPGLFGWLRPVFKSSNEDFLAKCGMDAYFFLRYLRTLVKIFLTLAIVILPILLPLNSRGGRGADFAQGEYAEYANVTGLDQFTFGNVRPDRTSRYWAHFLLAVFVIVFVCYVFFDELRAFIRLRQHWLTTPQHRLRASATTVLVTGIPDKYQSVEALEAMYDVFPGGIRNVWLNRNFDHLADKVKLRNKLSRKLEAAETDLIKKVHKAHGKQLKKQAKSEGTTMNRSDMAEHRRQADVAAFDLAQGEGNAAGNPHQVKHTIYEFTHDEAGHSLARDRKVWNPVPVVGQGLAGVGRGFAGLGRTVRQGVTQGVTAVQRGIGGRLDSNAGLVPETAADQRPVELQQFESAADRRSTSPPPAPSHPSAQAADSRVDDAPTDMDGTADAADADDGKKTGRWKPWPLRRVKTEDRLGPRPAIFYNEADGTAVVSKNLPHSSKSTHKGWWSRSKKQKQQYPAAYDEKNTEDAGEPLWKKYVAEKDRETMREPLFGKPSWPSVPFIGNKVDKIHWLRKTLAQLNLEIEYDQQHEENFPLMNSAFVQFNSQLAAHMACQSVSHHVSKQMAPRIVEISPDDVIWNNMSLRWWERYVRTGFVVIVIVGLSILWAFPVTFTGLLSQIDMLRTLVPWLDWIGDLPDWLISFIQGVLPQVILALLLALLPALLRFLTTLQGVPTGNGVELSVQNYFFIFLFVQVFLIVSISSGITSAIKSLIDDIASAPSILAVNLPRASNYFFSYMLIQAFSVSAGALLQIAALFKRFILAAIIDSTPRQKWAREMTLSTVTWGTFFPVYTNLAAIGIIYSVISPLILVFNIVTFSLFWVVYRYNTLYVVKFQFDTGGLLYPRAINQLFTGLYVMELCMIGLFFLVRDSQNELACRGQAIGMIVVTVLTVIYQYLLNEAMSPLFTYIPVSLEDMATAADKQFARLLETGTRPGTAEGRHSLESTDGGLAKDSVEGSNGAARPYANGDDSDHEEYSGIGRQQQQKVAHGKPLPAPGFLNGHMKRSRAAPGANEHKKKKKGYSIDAENQRQMDAGRGLFLNVHDRLEDLSADDRDLLVAHAFRHEALRAKRPVIWIPRDHVGVSDDEVYRTQLATKHVWISNEYTALDSRGKVLYSRSPPDFSEVDLIKL